MGKFDGILICSDLDGTFSWGGESVEINSKAIKYFKENGGRFTFATGRGVDHVSKPEFAKNISAPVCLYNGAMVYDFANQKIIRYASVPFALEEFEKKVEWARGGMSGIHEYTFDEKIGVLKVICAFHGADAADEFKSWAEKEPFFENTDISKSWSVGVEFTKKGYNKGTALDFIKSTLPDVHTVIGIGDYNNDLPLITHADIGVATDNAVDELKAVADFVVCDAKYGAIDELITKLEEKIKSGDLPCPMST